ncbi:hypothetical protein K438DRAFT_1940237 [Mycena galopus ATCC 62051]|nr:hypothetical protein K438DRAFT_1940237 [Mycena galopus ATCC 62051]
MHIEDQTLVALPPELERVIFELVAWNFPETITTLILVAKRVCIWIESELYRVLLITGPGSTDRLMRMMDSKPPIFLQKHVQHLALSSAISRADVTRVLSTCTNICDLTLWTGSTYPELLADLRNLTNLQHLSVNLFELFRENRQFQLPRVGELPFAHLTHLDVFSIMPEELWPFFGMLPRLTHLSFSDNYHPELVQTVLDTCAALELVVAVWTHDSDTDPDDVVHDASEISDPRFCIISCRGYESDWEEGAWGGIDFWYRAEVARQNRNNNGSASGESQVVPVPDPQ